MWKLRVGVEAYYLAQVASGLDEYYTGSGEAVGVWTGHGIAGLGLTGPVDPGDLRAVLAGLAPGTGLTPNGEANRPHARRVPGFDLTFSVPKSVSVLYAVGDPLVQGEVIDAAETSLAETLAWLEREATFVRRGSNDQSMKAALGEGWGTRRMVTGGLVAAQFRHRSSRAGDPHLHWHVLVANLAQGIDGRWSALDGTALYAAKRTAGVMFQTVLRQELSERLGVEWTPTRNDVAEVAGVPRRVLRDFSQRREQMEEWLEANGRTGAAAADEAMLATRPAKPDTDLATLTADWRQRATAAGFGPAELDTLLAAGRVPSGGTPERWRLTTGSDEHGHGTPTTTAVAFEEWLDHTLETRLTANESTFTRFDLTAAVAAALPGASIERIETETNRALASRLIVAVDPTRSFMSGPLGRSRDDRADRYTSRRLLDIETRLLAQLTVEREVAPIDSPIVNAALAGRPSLGFDQAHAIQLLTQPDAVQVMVGRPGTGKTYTLGALHEIYRAAGREVIGLAPSARAAREIEDGAGIPSRTIASFLHHPPVLSRSTVVVVDEAGMAGTRDLAAVLDLVTKANAKVILVGDHHQLAEVTAGGGFRAALDALSPVPGLVCELTINRRQHHAWEHTALDQLRDGDLPAAWVAYKAHDRVVLTNTPAELHQRLVADWQQLSDDTIDGRPADVVVLAGTRAETQLLNRAIRAERIAAGDVHDDALVIGERTFQVGDRVVLLRNDPHQSDPDGNSARVDNGMVGDITAIDHDNRRLTIRLKGAAGRQVVVDEAYLRAGHVDHGYALTVHKAQGLTCDHVLIAGPHGLNREAGYVALSRARHSARLYATVRQDDDMTERHAHGIPLPDERPGDPEAELLARLARSGAKQLTIVANPDAARIDDLASTHTAADLVVLAERARRVRDNAPCPEPDTRPFDAAVAFRTYAAVGRRVRALDRDNVGIIEHLDDRHGTVTVHFENTAGRSSTRTFDWHQLVVIDHPQPVDLPTDAITHLEHLAADIDWRRNRWVEHHHRSGIEPGDAERYTAAIDLIIERAARALRGDPPVWMTGMIGARPVDQARAVVWDDTVHHIADWRTRHNIDVAGLGQGPTDPDQFRAWQHLMVEMIDIAAYLAAAPRFEDRRGALTPAQVLARRDELHRLLNTAPPADRAVVDQLLNNASDAGGLHEQLAQAAAAAPGVRARWILEHWPQVVELEQLDRLAATFDPTVLWPSAQPAEVEAVLDVLRRVPEAILERESRTLAALARAEADANPVLQLQRRLDELEARAVELNRRLHTEPWADDPAAQSALRYELLLVQDEQGDIQRDKASEELLYSYVGRPETFRKARMVRGANVSYQALTEQPDWVVDHVRALYDNGTLPDISIAQIAEEISTIALQHDGHMPSVELPDPIGMQMPPIELAPDVPVPGL